LLIVVAIILIIAAIAIPNLIRSRMAANEASAVTTLRTLTTAFVTYSTTYGNGMPPILTALRNPPVNTPPDCGTAGAGLVDDVLAAVAPNTTVSTTSFTKSGYTFTYVPGADVLPKMPGGVGCVAPGSGTATVGAIPISIGGTGQRGFLIDNSGVIYFTINGTLPIPASSPVL